MNADQAQKFDKARHGNSLIDGLHARAPYAVERFWREAFAAGRASEAAEREAQADKQEQAPRDGVTVSQAELDTPLMFEIGSHD